MDRKLRLPWYALLFPITQLSLWWCMMSLVLADEAAGAAWIVAGVFLLLLCVVTDLLLFKALRQSTQLQMTLQRQQLVESSLEAQRKRNQALEQAAGEAAHVRRELSAGCWKRQGCCKATVRRPPAAAWTARPPSIPRRRAAAPTRWPTPSFRKSWRCAAEKSSR